MSSGKNVIFKQHINETTDNCFDVSLTVHLSITLANDQLDAQIF